MLPVPQVAVLSDWLSVPFSSAEGLLLLCFVSPGDSGSLPCTGRSAGMESITPGKPWQGEARVAFPALGTVCVHSACTLRYLKVVTIKL